MFDRIAGLALGYEDLNDHDLLRHDPVLGLLAGKLKGGRKDCAALAGKSTLNRLEHAPEGGEPGRYHFFHGYHGHYCFLPLYVFRGAHPLCAVLRPGNADPALGAVRQLRRILGQFRRRWPDVELIVRADSAYAREEIMAFREGERDIHYVLGVARNDRLAGRMLAGRRTRTPRRQSRVGRPRPTGPPLHRVRPRHPDQLVPRPPPHRQGRAHPRQAQPPLPRHIPPGDDLSENRLRAHLPSPGQRRERHQGTAARHLRRPHLRRPHRRQPAPAPVLSLRLGSHDPPPRRALAHTRLARATAGSLRLKLLRIGARVSVSVRRVSVAMDAHHPFQAEFARACARFPT